MDDKTGDRKAVVEYLVGLGKTAAQVQTIHDDGKFLHMVFPNGSVKEIRKEVLPRAREHKVDTLDSLLEYLGSSWVDRAKTAVWVSEQAVLADCAYNEDAVQTVTMLLLKSPEFLALEKLMGGVGQKVLWRLLVTDLVGCLPDTLLLAIGSLERATKATDNSTIDVTTGLVSGKREFEVSVVSKGTAQKVPFSADWEFSGPLVTVIDKKYTIPLRMELDDANGGLKFVFHAVGLDRIYREVQEDIALMIRTRHADLSGVYLGNRS